MILTKQAILQRIDSGHIVAPKELVQENSVNVRLGREMFKCSERYNLINPYGDREFIEAKPSFTDLYGAGDVCRIEGYWLHPERVYIGTTDDAYGTRLLNDGLAFVPEMRARSTTGRHGLTVALCAGFGDVGYNGRWALEIVNLNKRPIFLAVGTEIAQVVFHEATEAYPDDGYGGEDRYQDADGGIRFLPKPFKLPTEFQS